MAKIAKEKCNENNLSKNASAEIWLSIGGMCREARRKRNFRKSVS